MATKFKPYFVRHELTGCPVTDAEPWNVYTPDGETIETCFDNEEEAIQSAKEYTDSAREEAKEIEEAEKEELVRLIQERLEDMSVAKLRSIAKKMDITIE